MNNFSYYMTYSNLYDDYMTILKGHCIYLPNFFSPTADYSLLKAVTHDLEQFTDKAMINWSKHLKHENPDFSPTFKDIINKMVDYFDVEVYATRLNFYADGSDWKPFHHDSHPYIGTGVREDFTMGASFGASRQLVFLHPPSGQTFSFPQNNGDVFAFTAEANKRFQHGVPKASQIVGPRFSIIAWGVRRNITEKNSAIGEKLGPNTILQKLDPGDINLKKTYHEQMNSLNNNEPVTTDYDKLEDNNEPKKVIEVQQVSEMVQKFIQNQEKLKTPATKSPVNKTNNKEVKKSRVQGGGWAGGGKVRKN